MEQEWKYLRTGIYLDLNLLKLDRIDYRFDVTIDKQRGTMLIIKEIKNDQQIISQFSNLDMGFDRPLGFYNDTSSFTDGLYAVAKRMFMES